MATVGMSRASAREATPDPVADLVLRARTGDNAAFAALHRSFGPMVHGLLLARVESSAVDDLVQEVFLRAHQHLGDLREPAAFGAWLAQIGRRAAAKHLGRRRKTEALPDAMGRRDAPTVEAEQVLGVIRQLPEAYAETLVLRLVEGMTGPEIAARTGLSPDYVRVNLSRGMKKLRTRLKGWNHD